MSFRTTMVIFLLFLHLPRIVTACPPDWTDAMGSCYMKPKSLNDPVSWGMAQYICADADLRGHLPIFKDEMAWNVFQIGLK
uniref:C-type lectin domain-containing protein n=1 Tax=Romanomermis culicivorax TaxID=13658 RepID=A0A915I4L5_ROMCU